MLGPKDRCSTTRDLDAALARAEAEVAQTGGRLRGLVFGVLPPAAGIPSGLCYAKANFDGATTADRPWPPEPFPFDLFRVVDLGFWPSTAPPTPQTYEDWARETSRARGLPPPVRVDPATGDF